MDWQRGMVGSCTESEGFHKVSMAVLDAFWEIVSENDLLLLSKDKVSFFLVIWQEAVSILMDILKKR